MELNLLFRKLLKFIEVLSYDYYCRGLAKKGPGATAVHLGGNSNRRPGLTSTPLGNSVCMYVYTSTTLAALVLLYYNIIMVHGMESTCVTVWAVH